MIIALIISGHIAWSRCSRLPRVITQHVYAWDWSPITKKKKNPFHSTPTPAVVFQRHFNWRPYLFYDEQILNLSLSTSALLKRQLKRSYLQKDLAIPFALLNLSTSEKGDIANLSSLSLRKHALKAWKNAFETWCPKSHSKPPLLKYLINFYNYHLICDSACSTNFLWSFENHKSG